jgi:anti-sigma factor RsiW
MPRKRDLEAEWLGHMHRVENLRAERRSRRSLIPSISFDDRPPPPPPETAEVYSWPKRDREQHPSMMTVRLVWTAILLWIIAALAVLSWGIAWVAIDYLR